MARLAVYSEHIGYRNQIQTFVCLYNTFILCVTLTLTQTAVKILIVGCYDYE